jgi:hypothetical protein
MLGAQSSARQGTHIHDQSNQAKYKKGGYTPKYEKRAPTASEMPQNLEIHFSDHLNVGLPSPLQRQRSTSRRERHSETVGSLDV